MKVDLLKYLHTSLESTNIVNLFQWQDSQHCCETDQEGMFTCEWSYSVLHVSWESFYIFIKQELRGAHFSSGKIAKLKHCPFKLIWWNSWLNIVEKEMSLCGVVCTCISMENFIGRVRPTDSRLTLRKVYLLIASGWIQSRLLEEHQHYSLHDWLNK